MTDESAAAAITPADAAPGGESRAPSAADPELATRRVLLYEVLLEEYESHRPRDEGAGEGTDADAAAASARVLTKTLKEVAQPKLGESALETIALEGEAKRAETARIESECGRVAAEDSYNARLAADFFTLLTKAQRAEAEAALGDDNQATRAEYLEKLTLAWNTIPASERPSGTPANYLDRALAHEVYGYIDDLRERHRKATAYIEDEETRGKEIDRRALESWLLSIRQGEEAAARSKSKLTAEGAAALAAQEARAAQAEEIATAGAEQTATTVARPDAGQEQQESPPPTAEQQQSPPRPAAEQQQTATTTERAAGPKSQTAADLLNLDDPEVVRAFARVLQTVVAAMMEADRGAASQSAPERGDGPVAEES
jgi:hypothetical protein